MSESIVTVSETVTSRQPGPRGLSPIRWVVVATFVGIDGAEPRCVDYRVRVVPESGTVRDAHQVIRELKDDTISAANAATLGAVPPEGIPRYVFERASQARLLAKARDLVTRHPERHASVTRELLDRQRQRRTGRPPVRSIGEKLRILADVERTFASGGTLVAVADRHAMSRSAVRDLVSWARHDAEPPLFVSYGPGRRGGELTPTARAMLEQLEGGD